MTTQNSLTEVLMALLNIQNNLSYIEKELDVLMLDEANKASIKQITSTYFVVMFNCQEEFAALSREYGVFSLDATLSDLNDDKAPRERVNMIVTTLQKHNTLLTRYTDSLIAQRDKMTTDTEFAALVVLMTESVGNILHLSHFVTETLTNLPTNN